MRSLVSPQPRHPRRQGPASRARDTAARRAAWLQQRQEKQQTPAVEPSDVSVKTRNINKPVVEAQNE